MGIVNWFTSDLEKKDRDLTRDLITMTIADGDFAESERQEILRICNEEGISNVELMDTLRGKDVKIPQTKEEKFNYVAHLIKVMNADGECSPLEIHTLEMLAKRVGLNLKEIAR